MGQKGKQRTLVRAASQLPALFVLALCFLLGVFLGQALAGRVSDGAVRELAQYLSAFLELQPEDADIGVFFSTVLLYVRYPLIALLLGAASVGVVLLPCTAVLFGLLLSFSVSCFSAAYGAQGIVLALAVFGLRCAVTLPSFFLLAVPSLRRSLTQAEFILGRGRRVPSQRTENPWRAAYVGAFLLIGACADLCLSPWLLRSALNLLHIG